MLIFFVIEKKFNITGLSRFGNFYSVSLCEEYGYADVSYIKVPIYQRLLKYIKSINNPCCSVSNGILYSLL